MAAFAEKGKPFMIAASRERATRSDTRLGGLVANSFECDANSWRLAMPSGNEEAAPRGGFSSFKTMRLAQMLGRSPFPGFIRDLACRSVGLCRREVAIRSFAPISLGTIRLNRFARSAAAQG